MSIHSPSLYNEAFLFKMYMKNRLHLVVMSKCTDGTIFKCLLQHGEYYLEASKGMFRYTYIVKEFMSFQEAWSVNG